jgi:ribonuclease-3
MSKTNYINDGFIVKNPNGEEEILHIPYNLNNIMVCEKDIIQILNQYNINIDKVNHIHLFKQSFTHKSYCKKDVYPQKILDDSKEELGNPPNLLELQDASYERLEFLGDKVLKLIVSFYLFKRYPNEDEGFMTRLQTKIEDKKNLAVFSREIGLNKFFIISKQIESMNGRNLEKIHEDVFEAFLGALFESNGFETCMYFIVNLLETLIDYSEKLYCDNNYKDQLLRVHHQNKWKFPQYISIHHEGPPHKRRYIMGVEKQDYNPNCKLEDRCISFGTGYSKKEGEQNAAKMSLIILGLLKEDQYNKNDIYYPPWSKIANNEDDIIKIETDSDDNKEQEKEKELALIREQEKAKELALIREQEKAKELALIREQEKAKELALIREQEKAKVKTKVKTKGKSKKNKEINYDSEGSVLSDKSI